MIIILFVVTEDHAHCVPLNVPPIVESPSMSLPIVEWEYEWNESLLRKSHG